VGESWISERGLVVDVPRLMGFDFVVYAPSVEVPKSLPTRRYGDWVYCVE